jgi:hypothetical protein
LKANFTSAGLRSAEIDQADDARLGDHRGTATPGEIEAAYQSYSRQREKVVSQWHEMVMAAIRLGVPESEVRRTVSRRPVRTVPAEREDGKDERVQHLVTLYREALERAEADTR